MFSWLEESIDGVIIALDFRYFWRIYLSVFLGFALVFLLSVFLSQEQVSVLLIACCIVIPGVLGGIWHGMARKGRVE